MPKGGQGNGGGGSDIIKGNHKDNLLTGTEASDVIQGLRGDDVLEGLGGDDLLEGGIGADQLFGGNDSDTLLGGSGDDLLDGGTGNDNVDGGDGVDTAVFSGARDDYVVTQIDPDTIHITGPDGTDTFANVEVFQFTDMAQSAADVVAPRITDLTLSSANWDVLSDRDLNGGGTVSMQISVSNTGTIDATDAQIVTVLSRDATLSVDDVVVGTTSISLQAGESLLLTPDYSVPETLPAGSYELITYIDWSPSAPEQNLDDNMVTAQIPIRFIGGTTFGTSGDDVFNATDVAETFDMGAGDDFVSFSAGGNGDGDIVLGGDGTDTARFSGRREDFSAQQVDADTIEISGSNGITLLTNVDQFEFFDVTLDATDVLDTPAANVVATGLSVDDAVIISSDSPTLSWSVTQTGLVQTGTIQNKLVIAFAPALQSVISEQTAAFATLNNQGDEVVLSAQLDASSLAPGTYYVAAVADSTDAVSESDEADNISNWTEITVEAPVYNLSLDSVVINQTSDFDLNGEATTDLSITVSNTGNADIGFHSVQLFVSEDQIGSYSDGDDWLGAGLIDGLAAGETITLDVTRTIDARLLDGDYNLVARIQSNFSPDAEASDNQIVLSEAVPLTRLQLVGTVANDVLSGSDADETYNAAEGDDVMLASAGADVLDGGAGFDTADFSAWDFVELSYNGDPIHQRNLTAFPTEFGYQLDGQITTLVDVEKVIGTGGSDFFVITEGGVTNIDAGAGDDLVIGSYADDVLNGGDGNDLLGGLFGDDFLTGGDGADTFAFNRVSSPYGEVFGDSHDTITDFDIAMDMIQIWYDDTSGAFDPLSDVVDTADGALISYANDSSILLSGVSAADLDPTNVIGILDDPYVTVIG